ncbi:MAG: hypothetical protein E7L01_13535 [Paenibacillus macerans]|uniref:hypothetical protein n=1 Tax=Paenibacillus macerans TaxID=44252 RepID=UPI0024310590|nr:hypothetical protein [Paenibacillus macerans]MBS5914971.1 hypothetical protein [Paenibacillus macerans]MDU7474338.1 hypothetical protein [Paenibacillus macerans]
MKITDWAVVFVLIVSPFLWLGSLHAENIRETNMLETRYTTALRTAAQDGGSALNLNELQRYESGYGSQKWMRADKDRALSVLLQSLYIHFGVTDDPLAQQALLVYIPAIVVIDYDGYSIYAAAESADADGSPEMTHRWSLKKPYAYADAFGNYVSFTLDRHITAHDSGLDEWEDGLQTELKSELTIPLLQDDERFDQVRRTAIVHSIEENLAKVIHRHNKFALKKGVHYTFTLPVISQEEWSNTLDDVGVLVFLQGIPIGDRYYNNYALGGGRLVRSDAVLGGVNRRNGLKYYFRDTCPEANSADYEVSEVFPGERAAAASGYFQAKCFRSGVVTP